MLSQDQQPVGVHQLAAAVFIASFISIYAELFLGLVQGLKTWSHMVYLVISFALMGLGIGTTAWLLRGAGSLPGRDRLAWGINFGFTVLGSTLVILIAQFLGFRAVFLMAAGLYLLAMLSFRAMVGLWSQATPSAQRR